jgi:hypothetical protein
MFGEAKDLYRRLDLKPHLSPLMGFMYVLNRCTPALIFAEKHNGWKKIFRLKKKSYNLIVDRQFHPPYLMD